MARGASVPALSAVIACAAASFAPARAGAQPFEGARLLAFGEAQRAFSNGNDAIYVNPAGLALARAYSLEIGFLDDLRGGDRKYNASIIDSQAGPIAGGIAYTYTTRLVGTENDLERKLKGHRVDLSLATLVADSAAVGITGRYLNFGEKLGEEDIEGGGFSQFTLDAGFQWASQSGFAVGLAAYNLTNPDRAETPISWGAGAGYRIDLFSIEADVRYNAQIGKARFQGGAGYVIANAVPVRAGFSYDLATESAEVSFGLGFTTPQFGIDIGYRQQVSGPDVLGEKARLLGLAARATFM